MCGTDGGRVYFAQVPQVDDGLPWATPVRLRQDLGGDAAASWDDEVSAFCPSCGSSHRPASAILDGIRLVGAHLNPDQAPCISLPPVGLVGSAAALRMSQVPRAHEVHALRRRQQGARARVRCLAGLARPAVE